MSIPIVIVHIGDSYYLKDVVEFNAKKNKVFFIGCNKNAYLGTIPNVTHIRYTDIQGASLQQMQDHFLHLEKGLDTKEKQKVNADLACTNNGTYQFLCFARVYFVKKLMEQERLDLVFHLDSDCFLLETTEALATTMGRRLAYGIEHVHNNIHMVGSIHNAFLTKEFCTTFLQLYDDIYANGSKRHLLKHKIMCIQNKIGGGNICDMNLYYIVWQQKLLDVLDMTQPFLHKGEFCVFDHCIGNSTGFEGGQTYQTTRDEIGLLKKLHFKEGKVYQTTVAGKDIRLLSLHFNGADKQRIVTFRGLLSPTDDLRSEPLSH
jgi:hypothetical protein